MGTESYILSACRTPIGAFGGALKDLSAPDLGAIVVREAIARAGVQPADIGDVILGCVLQAGAGMNVARQAALKAGLPVEVPGETVNRVCGSGLSAVVHAVEALRCGYVDLIVAGGTESMSNAPYLLKGARWGYRMGHAEIVDTMVAEGLTCAIKGCHMGVTAEEIATRYQVSREDQDAFAAESQRRAAAAIAEGRFAKEIVAVEVPQKKGGPVRIERDEHPRPDTTEQKLAGLKAAFAREGSVTAGNASGINDGASALVVASEEGLARARAKPLARVLSYCTTGVDPAIMGMGPVEAIRKALTRAKLQARDLDLIELNEAFAAQSLAVIRELGLDPGRVNVHGGAVALGHPIGASGARILTTLVHALHARGARYGAASLCVGGGMGTAIIVERV
ncbi:MAG TPA: acetyl-CoA C-acetyltransferase [Vicinamibacterales bacterium]|nr:acetyl-CoA C-acetyltransferase [Vicinamibacterales bacterium]